MRKETKMLFSWKKGKNRFGAKKLFMMFPSKKNRMFIHQHLSKVEDNIIENIKDPSIKNNTQP